MGKFCKILRLLSEDNFTKIPLKGGYYFLFKSAQYTDIKQEKNLALLIKN